MQKLLFSLLFVCAIAGVSTLTGCKKDNGTTEEKIVGKWKFVKIDYHEFYDGQSETYSDTLNVNEFLQFNANGTVSSLEYGNSNSGTWKIQDNKLIINDGSLDVPNGFEIKKLTGSELVLYTKIVESSNYSEMTIYMKK